MPLDEKGRCHFTTTLFSLIRESLKIKILNFEEASEADMDEADNQLRGIIKKLWPFTEQEKLPKENVFIFIKIFLIIFLL